MARQVFPEDNPSMTVPVSEANATEEISAASANEREEEECEAIPPTIEPVVNEDVIVPDLPIVETSKATLDDVATESALCRLEGGE